MTAAEEAGLVAMMRDMAEAQRDSAAAQGQIAQQMTDTRADVCEIKADLKQLGDDRNTDRLALGLLTQEMRDVKACVERMRPTIANIVIAGRVANFLISRPLRTLLIGSGLGAGVGGLLSTHVQWLAGQAWAWLRSAF